MLTSEQKKHSIEEIKRFFYEERGEALGEIGAENLLFFFEKNIAPFFYNRGVNDARNTLGDHWERLEEALFLLEKQK